MMNEHAGKSDEQITAELDNIMEHWNVRELQEFVVEHGMVDCDGYGYQDRVELTDKGREFARFMMTLAACDERLAPTLTMLGVAALGR